MGNPETLKCEARGNPPPTLNCSRKGDGAPLPIGEIKSVTWAMNGTYVCHAESSHGIVTRDVFLTVCECPGVQGWVSGGQGARCLILIIPFCCYYTDTETNLTLIIILVTMVVIVLIITAAMYFYNRQRKIKIYKLQRAQEEAMKLKAQAPPP